MEGGERPTSNTRLPGFAQEQRGLIKQRMRPVHFLRQGSYFRKARTMTQERARVLLYESDSQPRGRQGSNPRMGASEAGTSTFKQKAYALGL